MRNDLHNTPSSIGAVSEETSVASVAGSESHLFTGRQPGPLYSGRAHHFCHYDIRGAACVVFYGLMASSLLPRDRGWVYWAKHWRRGRYGAAEGACDILQAGCYEPGEARW